MNAIKNYAGLTLPFTPKRMRPHHPATKCNAEDDMSKSLLVIKATPPASFIMKKKGKRKREEEGGEEGFI